MISTETANQAKLYLAIWKEEAQVEENILTSLEV